MKITRTFFLITALATVSACGGGGSGGAPDIDPPPPPASTYTVTLTAVGIERSADQAAIGVGGLPVEGATVTVD